MPMACRYPQKNIDHACFSLPDSMSREFGEHRYILLCFVIRIISLLTKILFDIHHGNSQGNAIFLKCESKTVLLQRE